MHKQGTLSSNSQVFVPASVRLCNLKIPLISKNPQKKKRWQRLTELHRHSSRSAEACAPPQHQPAAQSAARWRKPLPVRLAKQHHKSYKIDTNIKYRNLYNKNIINGKPPQQQPQPSLPCFIFQSFSQNGACKNCHEMQQIQLQVVELTLSNC